MSADGYGRRFGARHNRAGRPSLTFRATKTDGEGRVDGAAWPDRNDHDRPGRRLKAAPRAIVIVAIRPCGAIDPALPVGLGRAEGQARTARSVVPRAKAPPITVGAHRPRPADRAPRGARSRRARREPPMP